MLPVPGPLFETDGEIERLVLCRPPRNLTPTECRDVWRQTYEGDGGLAPHQLTGYRIVGAWRLVRLLASSQGRLSVDERLPHDAEQWSEPWPLLNGHRAPVAWQPGGPADHDEAFTTTLAELAEKYSLDRGSKALPLLGSAGLDGFLHLQTVTEAWPSREAILAFEDQLIFQCQGFVLKWPRRKAAMHLLDLLGLTLPEANGFLNIATEEARRLAVQDMDTKRYLMEAQLQDYIYRTREAADLNNEIKGHKMLAAVQGLTRGEADENVQFIGIMAKVSSEQDQKQLLQIEEGAQ